MADCVALVFLRQWMVEQSKPALTRSEIAYGLNNRASGKAEALRKHWRNINATPPLNRKKAKKGAYFPSFLFRGNFLERPFVRAVLHISGHFAYSWMMGALMQS